LVYTPQKSGLIGDKLYFYVVNNKTMIGGNTMETNRKDYVRLSSPIYLEENWPADAILYENEIGVAILTNGELRIKIGNGKSKWKELSYYEQQTMNNKAIATVDDVQELKNNFPMPTKNDSGKFLIVDEEGKYTLKEITIGGSY
jgi:hypothetical protein